MGERANGIHGQELALVDLHLGNGLPAVHGYKPSVVLPTATQIQDQL